MTVSEVETHELDGFDCVMPAPVTCARRDVMAAENERMRVSVDLLDRVITDIATKLGCAADNESILCEIDNLKHRSLITNEQHVSDEKRCVHGTPESQVCGKCCGYD